MKTIKFYNEYHLGDNGYHLHFCNLLCDKYPDLHIINYMNPQYISEINQHIHPSHQTKIANLDIKNKPSDAINCWINYNGFHDNYITQKMKNGVVYYDELYIDFFNYMMANTDYKSPITTKEEFLFNHPTITNNQKNIPDYDGIIINSKCFSGQWNHSDVDFDRMISKLLDEGKNIILTKESPTHKNLPTTWDYNCNLLDIGAIATKTKFVIGIHTSPILYTLNSNSYNNNIFIIFHRQGISYSYDKVFNIPTIFDNVYYYINNYIK